MFDSLTIVGGSDDKSKEIPCIWENASNDVQLSNNMVFCSKQTRRKHEK